MSNQYRNIEDKPLIDDEVNQADEVSVTVDDSHKPLQTYQKPFTAVINFANSVLGTGVLAGSYTMSRQGYIFAPIMYLLFFSQTIISYWMLKLAADRTHKFTYRTLIDYYFPKWFGYLVAIFHIIFNTGCLISYTIVCKDNFFFFDKQDQNYNLWRVLLLCGVIGLIVMPLCYLKSLDSLKFNSYVDVIAMLFLIFALAYTYFSKEIKPVVFDFNFDLKTLYAIPMMAHTYSATMQFNFTGIYKELEDRSKNILKVTVGNSVLALFVYFSAAFFGYFAYGSATQSNVIRNLSLEKTWVSIMANCFMIAMIIVHVPVVVYNNRKAIESLIFHDFVPRKWEIIIATGICCFMTLVGSFVDKIDNILDFTSSLCGGFIGLIVPGLLFAKLDEENKTKKYLGYLFAGIGACVVALGFGVAIYKWGFNGGL